jgi:hypothetical protein
MINEHPLYHVTFTRDALDKFLSHLSGDGTVDLLINERGEVSFNIPKDTGIDVSEINIAEELIAEADLLEVKQKRLKEGGKRWLEIEAEKEEIIDAAVRVIKILKKHYDSAKIE